MCVNLTICFLRMHGLGLHGLRCGWWTEFCLSSVPNWPGTFFLMKLWCKVFGQDTVLMLLQHLSMWFMVILRKEHLSLSSLLRGWRNRGRNTATSCLEVQQRMELLLEKHTVWTSCFSIPGYHTRAKCFPVKIFQKFQVSLRASQRTMMISELGTSVAISDGQLKNTGFCWVLQVKLQSTGIFLWLLMLLQ